MKGDKRLAKLKSTSRMAATVTGSGRARTWGLLHSFPQWSHGAILRGLVLCQSFILPKCLEKLPEKGARDAPGVDLAGTRRPKWAKKPRFGGRKASFQAHPRLFGQFLEGEFSEVRPQWEGVGRPSWLWAVMRWCSSPASSTGSMWM